METLRWCILYDARDGQYLGPHLLTRAEHAARNAFLLQHGRPEIWILYETWLFVEDL